MSLAHTLPQPVPVVTDTAGEALRRVSCGIVIVNDEAELLLCHVTGQDHWDLPKGGPVPGESPLATALRETREETSLVLAAADLLELGRLPYRMRKDLHLFAARTERLDTARLHCTSRFQDLLTGTRLPEMDGYDWVPFTAVGLRCTRKLASVLCGQIDLYELLARLQRAAPLAAARHEPIA
jgi:8-oxo-dGTP pyrophosphatase MutT (NUDIX family)